VLKTERRPIEVFEVEILEEKRPARAVRAGRLLTSEIPIPLRE